MMAFELCKTLKDVDVLLVYSRFRFTIGIGMTLLQHIREGSWKGAAWGVFVNICRHWPEKVSEPEVNTFLPPEK